MHITRLFARFVRTAALAAHLLLYVGSGIRFGVGYEWRQRHTPSRHGETSVLRRLAMPICHFVAGAVDPRTFFTCDGDGHGRRRKDLDRVARRQRRALADLRRRHAGMLLRALGDCADDVEAALTRDWQIYGGEDVVDLLGDYRYLRMRHRDPMLGWQIDIDRWVSDVGGVWVATPVPVRDYLRRKAEHEQRLEAAYTRRPRRGVRPAPLPA